MLFDERWRGTAPEKRDGYTGQLTRQLLADASGNAQRDPSATAAAEAAIGAYSRAFSIGIVTPRVPATMALTPALLGLIVRNVLRTGESVHWLEVVDGELRILPAGSHNVHGGPDPATWYYRITTYGPSGSTTVIVPATDTIHVKYAFHPQRPWRGVGPLQWSSSSSRLHAELEDALGDESSGSRGYILAMPQAPVSDDPNDADPNRQLREDIRTLRGRTAMVETVAQGLGEGPSAAPARDWIPQRLGIDAPQAAVNLRSDSAMAVLGALGIPPALFHANGTTPIREALRTWLHSGITPLAELVAEELTRKLGVSVELDFSRLYASDITSRSRALSQMVTAGMDLAEARRLTGLE